MVTRRGGSAPREVVVFWLAKIGQKSGAANAPKLYKDVHPGRPNLSMVNSSLYAWRRNAYWLQVRKLLRKTKGIRVIGIMMKLDVGPEDYAEVVRVIEMLQGYYRPEELILITDLKRLPPVLRDAVKKSKRKRNTAAGFNRLLNSKKHEPERSAA